MESTLIVEFYRGAMNSYISPAMNSYISLTHCLEWGRDLLPLNYAVHSVCLRGWWLFLKGK